MNIRIVPMNGMTKHIEAHVLNGSRHETEIENKLQRSILRGHK